MKVTVPLTDTVEPGQFTHFTPWDIFFGKLSRSHARIQLHRR
jgi:hypothetical protein